MADSYQNIKDGVKLILRTGDKKFFTLLRGDNLHVWDFPGGGIENGEGIEIAAKREFEEEVGIPFSLLNTDNISYVGEYTQINGTKLFIFYAETPLRSEEILKYIPKDIYERSHNETKKVDFLSLREIFRMRENEVLNKEGERILWGSFKPLLKVLDTKARDKSKLLRESFGEHYSAQTFLGRERESLQDRKKPFKRK